MSPGFFKLIYKYCPYLREHRGYLGTLLSHIEGPNGKLHLVTEVPNFQKRVYATMNVTTEDGQTYTHSNVAVYSHVLEPRIFSAAGYTNIREYTVLYKNSR